MHTEILNTIAAFREQHGYPPTLVDIATAHGVVKSTARLRLLPLEEAGLVVRDPYVARSIRLTSKGRAMASR